MANTRAVTYQAKRTLAALRSAVANPTADTRKTAAQEILTLRECFTHRGLPDWTGRSPEYRDLIQRLYREAGVPSDSASDLQATLRYHVNNRLHEVAPAEHRAALGLKSEGTLTTTRAKRAAAASIEPSSEELLRVALKALRAARAAGISEEAKPQLRKLAREAIDVLLG